MKAGLSKVYHRRSWTGQIIRVADAPIHSFKTNVNPRKNFLEANQSSQASSNEKCWFQNRFSPTHAWTFPSCFLIILDNNYSIPGSVIKSCHPTCCLELYSMPDQMRSGRRSDLCIGQYFREQCRLTLVSRVWLLDEKPFRDGHLSGFT